MFMKFIASILILRFLIVPLVCCCMKQAQAAISGVECCDDSKDEHGATHEHADHHSSSNSCDCHSFSTAAENASTVHVAVLSFFNSYLAIDVLALKSVTFLKGSMRMAYLGPPGGPSTVPLYTLYHSLRI